MKILCILPLLACAIFAAKADENTIKSEKVAAIVSQIQQSISQHYVIPEKSKQINNNLDAALSVGEFDHLNDQTLATRITQVLLSASNDKHLRVQYSPKRYAALSSTQTTTDADAETQYWAEEAKRQHYGIAEVSHLENNIGYLKFTSFWNSSEAYKYIDAALTLLQKDDALILDLTNNKGGESDMVRYLTSIFLNDQTPRHINTMYDGMKGTTTKEFSLTKLPLSTLAGKPLFVLISNRTFSAGEAFAEQVRNFKLGTLVGEKTAGAAYTVELLPIDSGFVLSLSTGQVTHPLTESNWEAKGVTPHIEAPTNKALEIAVVLATKAIKSKSK
jgi:C-terminal processing protease CtpA/Prc